MRERERHETLGCELTRCNFCFVAAHIIINNNVEEAKLATITFHDSLHHTMCTTHPIGPL